MSFKHYKIRVEVTGVGEFRVILGTELAELSREAEENKAAIVIGVRNLTKHLLETTESRGEVIVTVSDNPEVDFADRRARAKLRRERIESDQRPTQKVVDRTPRYNGSKAQRLAEMYGGFPVPSRDPTPTDVHGTIEAVFPSNPKLDDLMRSNDDCPECRGTGEVALLSSVSPCSRGCPKRS